MEQYTQDDTLFGLRFDETAREHVRKAAQWAMILVIIAVLGYVVSLIEAIVIPPRTIEYEGTRVSSGRGIGGTIFAIIIGLVINYFLYQFATFAKKGVNNVSQGDLNHGFKNLKIYFTITGIIVIVVLFFVCISLAFVGVIASR